MENEKKKGGKLKWIIIAVVVLLVIAVAASGSGDDDSDSPKVEPIETTQGGETTTATQTSRINVGSSISNDHVKISFKECNSDFKNYSQYADIKKGYKIVEAVFDFENISEKDIILNGFECYADGAKCDNFYSVDDYSSPVLETISSGRKLGDCHVYFEVPEDAKEIELEYEADYWDDEKYIFVVE